MSPSASRFLQAVRNGFLMCSAGSATLLLGRLVGERFIGFLPHIGHRDRVSAERCFTVHVAVIV